MLKWEGKGVFLDEVVMYYSHAWPLTEKAIFTLFQIVYSLGYFF